MAASFNWAGGCGGIQLIFLGQSAVAEAVAILAKYSWLGRRQRWCSVSEDGAGSGGYLS